MIKHLLLDFDGVLTDNFVYVNSAGEEMVRCSRSDGMGIQALKEKGVTVCIISSEINEVVVKRAEKLNVHCLYGVSNKLQALREMDAIDLSETAFIGNDLNDLAAMMAVGVPIAVLDAAPEIRRIARYVTDRRGGDSAVREAADWLLRRWPNV